MNSLNIQDAIYSQRQNDRIWCLLVITIFLQLKFEYIQSYLSKTNLYFLSGYRIVNLPQEKAAHCARIVIWSNNDSCPAIDFCDERGY